jgi:hypothetical protein
MTRAVTQRQTLFERTLEEDFHCTIDFKRIAVLPEHIEQFNLPTRPTKQTDTRARNWDGDGCVELDAMSPSDMRDLVIEAIVDLIDVREWEALQKIEKAERESLAKIRVA